MKTLLPFVTIFISIHLLLSSPGNSADKKTSPSIPPSEGEAVDFGIAGRTGMLIFDPEAKRLSMTVLIYNRRDKNGQVIENDFVAYRDFGIKVYDKKGAKLTCTVALDWDIFTPVLIGVASQHGSYSLPPVPPAQLDRAVITYSGKTVTVSLRKLRPF